MKFRTYTELSHLSTFEERFKYASLNSDVGAATFGGRRILNQDFYRSAEWKRVRQQVILRDNACDLACEERPIQGRIIIHHLNPLAIDDFEGAADSLLDPEQMVCVSHDTHNALHYGDERLIRKDYVPRHQNDTCPWR